jgi:predicted nicotinamide N-methyase
VPQLRRIDAAADLTHSALRVSLAEQLARLRGTSVDDLPAPLLDVVVRNVELPGGPVYVLRPKDWEALREEEGAAGRPVPYWARLWPSGDALARALAGEPRGPGMHVLELGCGLGLPSIVAARGGADVLATDGSSDAVAFTAHALALNELEATVAHADWDDDSAALIERGPFDLVLAADILYTVRNSDAALRILPQLLEPNGEIRLADPDRAGGRRFLAAARASFHVRTREDGDVRLHTLRLR